MATNAYQARIVIKDEKRAGTLINAAGRDAAKTAIFLDNGSVVASPLTVRRLMNAIERSNSKRPDVIGVPKSSVRMQVYDVIDQEPDPEIDEEVPEIDVCEDEEDLEYVDIDEDLPELAPNDGDTDNEEEE